LTEYLHQLKEIEFTDFWLQAKSELFLQHLPDTKNKRVLDLGSGTGLLSFKLAERGWKVDALEPSAEAVQWIREKKGRNVNVIHNSLEGFKGKKKYALIVASDVLEHIEDDESALEKINEMLEPGGTFILSVPAHPALWNAHDEYCEHCRRYRKSELHQKLKKHFNVEKLRYWNFAMLPIALANKMLYQKKYPHQAINSVGWLNRSLTAYYLMVENTVAFPIGISLFAVAKKA